MDKNEITRRDFLRVSGMTIAGLVVAPSVLGLANSCENGNATLNDYYSHFEVDESMIRKVIKEALSKGGDYCDVFFEHTIGKRVSLMDNEVNRATSNVDYGVGIRVLKGDQTGYAFSEEITLDAMLNVAKTAANIANSASTTKIGEFKALKLPDYYKINKNWDNVSIDTKIPFVKKLNDRIHQLDKRVEKVTVSLNDSTSFILFANSEGTVYTDYRPMVSFSAFVTMNDNGRREQGYAASSYRKGFEFLDDKVVEELAQEAIAKVKIMFEAVKPKSGEMPVVLGAGGSGILMHEAIGHTFEADFNRKQESIFCDKMGKKVAEDFISIVDDGTIPNARGSINVDDEGNLTEKTYMVKDGVLTSYLHDRISAKFYKVKPTGNGRRESFRYSPMPRMRCTYMLNGPHKKEDIISSVKYGIYVDSFSNGEVKIGAGDFTFYVNTGYIIENGKLTKPIKDVNIIGNGPKALADITMVSNDLKIDNSTWTCGKNGQSAPVVQGLPTVKVSKLTVGGIN